MRRLIFVLLLTLPLVAAGNGEIIAKAHIEDGAFCQIKFGAAYVNVTAHFKLSNVYGWYIPAVIKYPGEKPVKANISELGYYDRSHGILYVLENVTDNSTYIYVKVGEDEKAMGIEVISFDLIMSKVRFFAPNGKVISLGIGESYEVYQPQHEVITLKDFVKEGEDVKALFEIYKPRISAELVVLQVSQPRKMDVVFVVGSKAAPLDFQVAERGKNELSQIYAMIPGIDINVALLRDLELEDTENKIIVTIGGPAANEYTAEINKSLPIKFEKRNGRWILKSEKKTWDKDYGVIAVVPFWQNGELKQIDIVLAGITRWTTKSAYETFSSEVMRLMFGNPPETPVGVLAERVLNGDYTAIMKPVAVVVDKEGNVIDVIIGGPGGI